MAYFLSFEFPKRKLIKLNCGSNFYTERRVGSHRSSWSEINSVVIEAASRILDKNWATAILKTNAKCDGKEQYYISSNNCPSALLVWSWLVRHLLAGGAYKWQGLFQNNLWSSITSDVTDSWINSKSMLDRL